MTVGGSLCVAEFGATSSYETWGWQTCIFGGKSVCEQKLCNLNLKYQLYSYGFNKKEKLFYFLDWISVAKNLTYQKLDTYKGRFTDMKSCAIVCREKSSRFLFQEANTCNEYGCKCWCKSSTTFSNPTRMIVSNETYFLLEYLEMRVGKKMFNA